MQPKAQDADMIIGWCGRGKRAIMKRRIQWTPRTRWSRTLQPSGVTYSNSFARNRPYCMQ